MLITLKNVITMLMSLLMFFTGFYSDAKNLIFGYDFSVDTSNLGAVVGNKASNANVWDMGTLFYDVEKNTENDVFEFTEYIQLMQCTGGNKDRDLFKNPLDASVKDDYDFARLIKNCEGILKLGAKPHLKLGNVPLKFTSDALIGKSFDMNMYPPDDYNDWYNYIYAIGTALVEHFGRDEVLQWRFGVMTEFDNPSWFIAKSGTSEDTAEAYCKLYDHAVAALEDSVGDIFIGAHAMTYPTGSFDVEVLVRHCALEPNYKTGKTGTRLCFLAASFYDQKPGEFRNTTLAKSINYLRSRAEKYGYDNIIYGVDEGRIFEGNVSGAQKDDLQSRAVGYTWQAAYDARIYAQSIENNVDYFSFWGYMSQGLYLGNPTVSYHVAKNISKFATSKLADTKLTKSGLIFKGEVNAVSAFDEAENTLHIMAYNFKNKLDYKCTAKLVLDINVPQLADGEATLVKYVIDDDCNFFDEWVADREANGITADCYNWSPDDSVICDFNDERAKNVYLENFDKYTECSKLIPVEEKIEIKDSKCNIKIDLAPNTVVFFEIKK